MVALWKLYLRLRLSIYLYKLFIYLFIAATAATGEEKTGKAEKLLGANMEEQTRTGKLTGPESISFPSTGFTFASNTNLPPATTTSVPFGGSSFKLGGTNRECF